MAIKLVLVDDEQLFIDGLQLLLGTEPDFEVLFTASDGSELMEKLNTSKQQPDIIVLDLKMKPMDGIKTTEKLREEDQDTKIVILSTYYREAFIGQMVKMGVNAFLPKNSDTNELKYALRTVAEKGLYFTEDLTQILREQVMGKRITSPTFQQPVQLTSREKEVLKLICEQYTAHEIADRLHISNRTVDGHRNNLLLKIGAKNIVGLVVYAIVNGYLDMEKKLLDYTLSY